MEDMIRLNLVGITYNQIESGVYAVILQQADSSRRLPIIIGYPEAQAIECKLQEVVTPRPLTHDMMVNFMNTFGLSLVKVVIKKLPNTVFGADLYFTDGTDTRVVDSRSSDAIALAIRVGAPIYTSAEVMAEAGFEADHRPQRSGSSKPFTAGPSTPPSTPTRPETLDDLRKKMADAAEHERYEEAARLREKIRRLEQEEQ